jgi:hypothetical protein
LPKPPIGGPAPTPPLGGGALAAALPTAVVQLSAAIAHVAVNTTQAQAELASLFPGIAPATVFTGLTGLMTEVSRMPALGNHRCHDYPCDGGCDRPAYADPVGRVMTLCPSFLNNPSPADNATTLLHEGLHMVPGLTTVDTAYRGSRLIDFITGAEAVTNTDSYVVLILRLAGAAAGGPPTDPVGTLLPAERTAARRALAFTEQWLLTADWDTTLLYEAIKTNKGRVGGWNPAETYQAGSQHAIAATFGLTDPGPAAPFLVTPTENDQWIVAGVHDRYNRMMRAVWSIPITVTSSAAGPDAWAANLGSAVTVTPAFFALTAPDQVLRLIELMAASLPPADVPVARRRTYAIGAQQLWTHSGRTGP